MSTTEKISFVLQSINQIVGILLFGSMIIGIRQLKLMKEDNRAKNERAAMEKSLEYLDWFAASFLPFLAKYREKYMKVVNSLLESEKFGEKHKEDLRRKVESIGKVEVPKGDVFKNRLDKLMPVSAFMEVSGATSVLNQLEYFAAAMTSGVAHEELVFNPLSAAYCSIVEDHYYIICKQRVDNDKLYSNIVKLYNIWKPKLQKEEMLEQSKKLAEELAQIPDVNIKSIGL